MDNISLGTEDTRPFSVSNSCKGQLRSQEGEGIFLKRLNCEEIFDRRDRLAKESERGFFCRKEE